LTSPSENMREKSRHDRETTNCFIEACFFASFKKKLHFKCTFANILLISFIFNFKFMFFTHTIVVGIFLNCTDEIPGEN
jgi:hypothetical protein